MYFIVTNDNNKNTRGTNNESIFDNTDTYKLLKVGEVVSVNDPTGLHRIQVRIKGPIARGGDDGVLDGDLPWCVSMLPLHLSAQPKPKEAVYIFNFSKDKQNIDRLFIGPIISQSQQLNFDPMYVSALRGFSFGSQVPDKSVDTIPELNGVFPDPQDISIQGRYNTDITQKTNEIVIRSGKFVETKVTSTNPFPFSFNSTTQSYIQLKNGVIIQPKTTTQAAQIGTVVNVVGNKINLLTHAGGNPRFNITNQDNLISDKEMANIIANAYSVPLGEIVLQYLQAVRAALIGHYHNGSNPPCDLTTGNSQPVAAFKKIADKLEAMMLSKNVKIN